MIKTFCCMSRDDFDKPFPYFRKPVENGYFSKDRAGTFLHDKSLLRFYYVPNNYENVCFDLKRGYRNLIKKDETKKEYLDDLLRWVMLNYKKFQLEVENDVGKTQFTSLHTDFICWRGLLTKLLCTPFENRDDWCIAVCLFNGTYYLCEFDTEKKEREKRSMSDRQDEMCYWGWKFEQYVTADKPDGKPNTSQPVNNNEAFCTVVRTRLTSHSLVFGGEVDAVDPRSAGVRQYVEMKTTREIDTHRQMENFKRFKLIKWWAQSFLVGITKIVCGYRDDDGVVHRIEEMDVPKLPDMAKNLRDPWNPAICFNFLDQFLQFIKNIVKVDDPQLFAFQDCLFVSLVST
ncbi:decapping and exoribonuclease protein-like isoform X2 [Gigantopelta aegis]|uniref:decapping and exoribonuclease protein-like isoform X2 n=1 Tax=Gigantopelta aegis TaxID=1735272 RepID=UPI001B88B456|nr:decapping and exoribonuclease protein-like isoform X2 [Gigantopelta aegis]